MKKILFLLIAITFVFACNNSENQSSEAEIIKINLVNFEKNAVNLVNKKIEITAIVRHVCEHGGQRLFLVSEETEESAKVVLGKNVAAFKTDLVGNTVKIIGTIDELRIDETYLLEWENEIKAEIEQAKKEVEHTGGTHITESNGEEADQDDHKDAIENIADYRKQIAESGTDHLSFFSIICEKYELIKPTEN